MSAALIVRDEAASLRRCLSSIADVVDEIVVVDTGSVDESVEVAESFDAIVLHRPWDGQFAAPRNLGLDRVTGDWVLYIDADEWLVPTTRQHLEQELADPRREHLAMRLRLKIRSDFTPLWEYRLWRNRHDIRFEGLIHESHVACIRRIVEAEDLRVGHADLLIHHDGYEGDRTPKHRRNLPLLEAQVANDPDRTYLWTHIGRAHDALGDSDAALDAWRQAVSIIRRNGVREHVDCLAYVDLILAQSGRGAHAQPLVDEADELFPDNALILWAGAVHASALEEHRQVIDRVDRLLAIDPDETARHGLTLNEHTIGDWAHHLRGLAKFHVGDHRGAAADFAMAEHLAPEVGEYRYKHLLARARAEHGNT